MHATNTSKQRKPKHLTRNIIHSQFILKPDRAFLQMSRHQDIYYYVILSPPFWLKITQLDKARLPVQFLLQPRPPAPCFICVGLSPLPFLIGAHGRCDVSFNVFLSASIQKPRSQVFTLSILVEIFSLRMTYSKGRLESTPG